MAGTMRERQPGVSGLRVGLGLDPSHLPTDPNGPESLFDAPPTPHRTAGGHALSIADGSPGWDAEAGPE